MPRTKLKDATAARHAYRQAEPLRVDDLQGDWLIEFVSGDEGTRLRGQALRLLGLANFRGPRFRDGSMIHMVGKKRRSAEEVHHMVLLDDASHVDGRPTVAAVPPHGTTGIWAFVRGEVRRLDADRLIGVHLVGPSRVAIPLPFVLRADPDA